MRSFRSAFLASACFFAVPVAVQAAAIQGIDSSASASSGSPSSRLNLVVDNPFGCAAAGTLRADSAGNGYLSNTSGSCAPMRTYAADVVTSSSALGSPVTDSNRSVAPSSTRESSGPIAFDTPITPQDVPTPEPSSLMLLAAGGIILLLAKLVRKHHSA